MIVRAPVWSARLHWRLIRTTVELWENKHQRCWCCDGMNHRAASCPTEGGSGE